VTLWLFQLEFVELQARTYQASGRRRDEEGRENRKLEGKGRIGSCKGKREEEKGREEEV
jgi:hypothetical protein